MGIVTRLNPLGGTLKFYIFRINPTPSSAAVVINGTEQRSIVAKSGTVISWRVNLSGYTAQEGILTLTENTTINLELPQTQYQKLIINPDPEDSRVIINDVEQKEITLLFASPVTWRVEHQGYISQSGVIDELIDDVILNINLEKQKYLFTINTNPDGAVIYINNVLQKSALIPYNESADWRVQKYGYATQSGTELITENKTLDVELVEVPFYTFTITPNPSDCIVVINDEHVASVSLEQNAVVVWSVSKDGFIPQNGILNLVEDKTLDITLIRKKFTLQIATVPADCTIKINGMEQNSIIADFETKITYSVERQGYVSEVGEITILKDTLKNVTLKKENYTLTIAPNPSDAIVFIDGIERTSITAPYDTDVSWSVSRIGHVSQSGIFKITENSTKTIDLEKKLYKFNLVSNKDDAIITVNGEPFTAQGEYPYGTVINWSVVLNGYEPQSGSLTLTEDKELKITLLKKIFKVIIAPDPADSEILINGIRTNFIEAEFETQFEYSVSHQGYVTANGTYTITGDWTMSIKLQVLQYTFSVNPTPANASVIINGAAQKSVVVNYGTTVSWSVSATGYATQSGNYTVLSDYTLNVLLSLGYFTVTINPTPADASVYINGAIQRAITAVYGTSFSWSASAPYHISQSGSEAITRTYTKNVVLAENVTTVSLGSCTSNASPCASYSTRTGSYISWKINNVLITTSGISAFTSNVNGIVFGPCKVKMSYSYSGASGKNFSYNLVYDVVTGNRIDTQTVAGREAVIYLNEGQKLRRFGMSYRGSSSQLSANQGASCSFSCYKYV